jgi:hypothetical protein
MQPATSGDRRPLCLANRRLTVRDSRAGRLRPGRGADRARTAGPAVEPGLLRKGGDVVAALPLVSDENRPRGRFSGPWVVSWDGRPVVARFYVKMWPNAVRKTVGLPLPGAGPARRRRRVGWPGALTTRCSSSERPGWIRPTCVQTVLRCCLACWRCGFSPAPSLLRHERAGPGRYSSRSISHIRQAPKS